MRIAVPTIAGETRLVTYIVRNRDLVEVSAIDQSAHPAQTLGAFFRRNFTVEKDEVERHLATQAIIDVPAVTEVNLRTLIGIRLDLRRPYIPQQMLMHQRRPKL